MSEHHDPARRSAARLESSVASALDASLAAPAGLPKDKDMALIDLLDRILDKGVIISGEIVLSVANVDLVYVGLKVLLTSVDRIESMRPSLNAPDAPGEPAAADR